MSTVPTVFVAAGVAALVAALLPGALRRLPISEPIVFVAAGVVIWLIVRDLFVPAPVAYGPITEQLTAVCVIVSLMGAGLAIDRPLSRRGWRSTSRLLGLTMPMTIGVMAVIGWWGLQLGAAAALLLAAALAPTDPVLASDVEVGEPSDSPNDEDEVRFALTSEAGLNDGLAFPFVYAALAIGVAGYAPGQWIWGWMVVDVGYRILAGVAAGLAAGWLIGRLIFRSGPGVRLSETKDGFVALGATFLAYGGTELLRGYGFVAVFVCACAIRAREREHGYHRIMHGFVDQIERLLTVLVLVLVGAAIARGALAPLSVADVVMALALVFVVRPVSAWVALSGAAGRTGDAPPRNLTARERAAIAFFGVRGVGTIYYLAFGLNHLGDTAVAEKLWAIGILVIIVSVVVHGLTAKPFMRYVDARRRTG